MESQTAGGIYLSLAVQLRGGGRRSRFVIGRPNFADQRGCELFPGIEWGRRFSCAPSQSELEHIERQRIFGLIRWLLQLSPPHPHHHTSLTAQPETEQYRVHAKE